MVFAKVVRNQMVPSRAEWRGETNNQATTPVVYCPSTVNFSVRPYCKNARRDRCQEYHNCSPFGELEETTRTSSNYVDEDYPTRPEIKQSLPGWGDNCGSESSTLETDVCIWHYAPLVVLATQEEEEVSNDGFIPANSSDAILQSTPTSNHMNPTFIPFTVYTRCPSGAHRQPHPVGLYKPCPLLEHEKLEIHQTLWNKNQIILTAAQSLSSLNQPFNMDQCVSPNRPPLPLRTTWLCWT